MSTGMRVLSADTVNGVRHGDIPSTSTALVNDDFYDVLFDLEDGVVVYGYVSDEIAKKIDDEYGIR